MNKIILACVALGAMLMAGALVEAETRAENPDLLTREMFVQWAATHNRHYRTAEEMNYRQRIFHQTMLKINAHNRSGARWTEGLNQFSDMTLQEVKAKYFGYDSQKEQPQETVIMAEDTPVANDIDWVALGAVTPVKNQGSCGADWAFSTTGSLEGLYFLTTGAQKHLLSFSEQQLIDCAAGRYGNQGCTSGLMTNAFQFVIKQGIETESQYPYTGVQGDCKSLVPAWSGQKGFANVQKKSSSQLTKALNRQPVSAAIEADHLINYSGGVYDNPKCGTHIDHGVLITGYTADVWKVKFSWGTSWGEAGYIQLARSAETDSQGGICGILLAATYPTD